MAIYINEQQDDKTVNKRAIYFLRARGPGV